MIGDNACKSDQPGTRIVSWCLSSRQVESGTTCKPSGLTTIRIHQLPAPISETRRLNLHRRLP
jgi:hypothetical protein